MAGRSAPILKIDLQHNNMRKWMSVGRSVGARTTHTHARTHMCKQIAKVQRKELSAHQRNLHIVQSSVCGLEYARQASLSLWQSEIETGSAQNFRKKRYFSWPMHARTSPHKRVHNFASTQIGSDRYRNRVCAITPSLTSAKPPPPTSCSRCWRQPPAVAEPSEAHRNCIL